MKAPINDPEQEALDLLFFEYLEDELPADETEALEQRLAHDPALQDELESWKDAYVEEDFYDTTALESQMQTMFTEKLVTGSQPVRSFSFFNSLNGVVPFMLTSMLSFMLATDQSLEPVMVFPEKSKVEATESIASDIPTETEVLLKDEEEGSTMAAPKKDDRNSQHEAGVQPAVAVQDEREQPERSLIMHFPEIAGLSMEMLHSNMEAAAPVVTVKKVRMPKKVKENNISRQQQRKIRKHKDKALQERQAREFMKGNVPYVVPLNSQNF